jgi:hypothetical protein
MQEIQAATVTALFACNNADDVVSEMVKHGPVAVVSSGNTIAGILSPEDFHRLQRRPRTLGFATDLIGDFDIERFNAISPEEMGFDLLR